MTLSLKCLENRAAALVADLEPNTSRELLIGALPSIRRLEPHKGQASQDQGGKTLTTIVGGTGRFRLGPL
jgi:hypothetical protein